MRLTRINGKKVSGFTLVEMAIVLVIIGIILAGIMKGRDIVRGSQVKQFSQGFAQKWVTIAATYYDKVGQHLCDGVNNGGQGAVITTPNGLMDGELFDVGVAAPTGSGNGSTLLQALRDVGITPCTMIKSDLSDWNPGGGQINCGGTGYNIYERMVDGEDAGKSRVSVGFFNMVVNNARRNCVLFMNVPTDVAVGLDTLIDGQADGENGACVNITATATAVGSNSDGFTDGNEGDTATLAPYPSQVGSTDQLLTILLVLDY